MEFTITENANVSVSTMPMQSSGMTSTSQSEEMHLQGWRGSDSVRNELSTLDLYSNTDLAIADIVGLSPIALSDWYTSAIAEYPDVMITQTLMGTSLMNGSTGHSPKEADV